MAVAFDNASAAYRASASTSHSFSFTVGSGSERALCIFIHCFDGDRVTGVTYNSTSMTQVNKVQQGSSADFGYMYYLNAPTSGANNFVVSISPSARISWAAASYSGVKQTGQPEANNTAGGGGTSATVSTTTLSAANYVVFGYIHNEAATDSYTNVTERAIDSSNGTTGIGDVLQTSVGAVSQTANWATSQQYAANTAALAPATPPVTDYPQNNLLLLGVS